MRNRILGSAMALALLAPGYALAANNDLTEIRRQIELLNQRREEDARRIRELEARVKQADDTAQRAVEQARQAAARPAAPAASSFNPGINVVLDGKLGVFSRDPENYSLAGFPNGGEASGQRGFFLGEAELNAFANVDDWFYGNLTLAFEQNDNETEVELEEAFVDTLFLPYGFQARAGKFFSGIGYLNPVHAHADDFVDRPLAYRAFLDDQYGDVGARLTWVAPTDIFLQLGAEAFRGDSFPAAGARNRGIGTQTVFAKAGGDIGPEWSWQGGFSWLFAKANERDTDGDLFSGNTDVGLAHLVFRWAPDGNPARRNLKLQTELFRNHDDGSFNGTGFNRTDWGFYAQAVYQFAPQWRTGYRFDWLSAGHTGSAFAGTSLDDTGHDPTRHSAMIEYNRSEFSRIRLQYSYDRSRPDKDDHQFLAQYTVTLGAHPPHGY